MTDAPVYGWARVKLVCAVAAEEGWKVFLAALPVGLVALILYVGYCR